MVARYSDPQPGKHSSVGSESTGWEGGRMAGHVRIDDSAAVPYLHVFGHQCQPHATKRSVFGEPSVRHGKRALVSVGCSTEGFGRSLRKGVEGQGRSRIRSQESGNEHHAIASHEPAVSRRDVASDLG